MKNETDSLVRLERDAGVTTVTLDRPESLNALSSALREQLTAVLRQLAGDDATQVVILTGAGRAFSAGLDLKELGGEIAGEAGLDSARDPDDSVTVAQVDRDVCAALRDLGKPVIGAVHGVAITGGFEIALACDILIASTEARFADTHARVGVVPGWGLSQRLQQLIGRSRAMELSLTGNFLDAATAERWGLVNRVVAPEDLLPHCRQLAADIVSTEPVTRGEIHRLIRAGSETTLAEGLELEASASAAHARREVSPDKVRQRREAIQQRGRRQQG